MPTYIWECNCCGHAISTIQSVSEIDTPPVSDWRDGDGECTHQQGMTRVISTTGKQQYAEGWGSDRKGLYGGGASRSGRG